MLEILKETLLLVQRFMCCSMENWKLYLDPGGGSALAGAKWVNGEYESVTVFLQFLQPCHSDKNEVILPKHITTLNKVK